VARYTPPPIFQRNSYGCGTASTRGRNFGKYVSSGKGMEHSVSIGYGRGVNRGGYFGGGVSTGGMGVLTVREMWVTIEF